MVKGEYLFGRIVEIRKKDNSTKPSINKES
jgi:hypothetical protein